MSRALILLACLTVAFVQPPATGAGGQTFGGTCEDSLPNYIDFTKLPWGQVAPVVGCRQLITGEWVQALVGDTRSFRSGNRFLPAKQQQIIADVRLIVLDELRKMTNDQRIASHFYYDVDTYTMTTAGLTTDGSLTTYSLLGQPLIELPQWTAIYRDTYYQAATSYLQYPDNSALAEYVLWYGRRRDSVLLGLANQALAPNVFLTRYQYGGIPWPWQLADPYTIDEFLIHLAESMPAPAPTAQAEHTEGGPEPPLSIQITAADGALLGGACLRITSAGSYRVICDGDPSDGASGRGIIQINLYAGTYSVEETIPPAGYEIVEEPLTVVVGSDGGSLSIVHEPLA
ncbi:MAG: hypothetical protein QOJ59_5025 [Thermomicrobiales bacterium]|jgi:hypothetical protein|nr:hypothetical protein [Thermomicrobiales bacterium]